MKGLRARAATPSDAAYDDAVAVQVEMDKLARAAPNRAPWRPDTNASIRQALDLVNGPQR